MATTPTVVFWPRPRQTYESLRRIDGARPWCCFLPPLLLLLGFTSSTCLSRCGPADLVLCSAYVADATGMPRETARDQRGACRAVANTRWTPAVRADSADCKLCQK
ncbi:hypothetical protein MTO96_019619 [Rhipicephalus appendiculatus]